MTRTVLTTTLIILLNVLVGCGEMDAGKSQLVTAGTGQSRAAPIVKPAEASEADLIEQVAANRAAYQQSLVSLIDYYNRTGNNLKLGWARTELAALETMPKYNYVIEATIAGPDLKATTSIKEADELYDEARELHKEAERLIVIKDENLLRLALDKYIQLIRKYPSSDKIDDAAFRAGEICEHFKDYSIALLYFQRTFQWNPTAPYPARFKAAYILDIQMHRRAEALELYLEAVETEGKDNRYYSWKVYAQERIEELSKSGGGSQ